ncbi:MAG: ATP-dependent sacrificial sulfur transferase LarE [Lachnospiraceae bacterium]|nr:ATP-dependent sacrificial sulfur transferase LarE [Lachnospiraceae bacterium]
MGLRDFFEKNDVVALAFSGGVDSSYLLYAAHKYAKRVCAYYVKSEFQPQFELDDAKKLAEQLGADIKVINLSVLGFDEVTANPYNRCYFCKRRIMSSIMEAAKADGFEVLIEGTNASDEVSDRPGMKALTELKILSPLRDCGITKDRVRELSKEAGLFTWEKPSYACLATRIAQGVHITGEALSITEQAEGELMRMGFSDFRIRMVGKSAKIQVNGAQFDKLIAEREAVCKALKKYYDSVMLDLETRG